MSARRRPPLALLLVVFPVIGCATAYTRGLVEDSSGAAVPGASARLVGAGAQIVAAERTDAHGCFFLQRTAPKGERQFTLEIAAEGYKPVRLEVPLQPPIFLVTLALASSGEESGIRPTTAAERRDQWEPQCIPLFAGGGAQSLGPN